MIHLDYWHSKWLFKIWISIYHIYYSFLFFVLIPCFYFCLPPLFLPSVVLIEHFTWFHLLFFPQFSSVAQSCPTLCDPMNRSTPCLPVHHQLPESTQTHVHWVGDVIQPSHPLSSPSPSFPALGSFLMLTPCIRWPQ